MALFACEARCHYIRTVLLEDARFLFVIVHRKIFCVAYSSNSQCVLYALSFSCVRVGGVQVGFQVSRKVFSFCVMFYAELCSGNFSTREF